MSLSWRLLIKYQLSSTSYTVSACSSYSVRCGYYTQLWRWAFPDLQTLFLFIFRCYRKVLNVNLLNLVMFFSNAFCTTVEAFASLFLLIVLTECGYVEKRNVLLIVGNVPHLPHTVHTAHASKSLTLNHLLRGSGRGLLCPHRWTWDEQQQQQHTKSQTRVAVNICMASL